MYFFLLRLPSLSLEGRVKGLYEDNSLGTGLIEKEKKIAINFALFSVGLDLNGNYFYVSFFVTSSL